MFVEVRDGVDTLYRQAESLLDCLAIEGDNSGAIVLMRLYNIQETKGPQSLSSYKGNLIKNESYSNHVSLQRNQQSSANRHNL